MKVLFAASEAAPFIKTGGLADVAGSLPAALAQAGTQAEIRLLNLGERFVPQGTVPQLRRGLGLDAQGIFEAAEEVCHGKQ